MGLLVNGEWQDRWYDTSASGGRFVRKPSQFREQIGSTRFPAEPGRYQLYVSYACPWAHRTLIVRQLKGLQKAIGVSVVHPLMADHGWAFGSDFAGATAEPQFGASFLYELYQRADAQYTGRVTVPVLWDKLQQTIVNNESSEIIRMFNQAFDRFAENPQLDLYPAALRAEIDAVNERVYNAVNNGVYRAGFATSQAAYQEAYNELFAALDWLEQRLAAQRYLVGTQITEADWRLFTTLVRFDAVYVGHFKCNRQRIADFENLSNYLRELYQLPGVASTVRFDHIKHHYYASHTSINPTRVVPLGPELNLEAPHDRDRFDQR
ncbi:MAG: glutathione S-transferase family protein [Deltaproteobacteria bacterium]|nr:glutathione S-transferase family protein [Deltaproteobacteria bacterium]